MNRKLMKGIEKKRNENGERKTEKNDVKIHKKEDNIDKE